ncbi:MAG: hypothetical protein GY729_04715 [Desulfobacteraceae bacterium]|nr:hypothetical protein [Desulfobacteraceae bacterium]
MKSTPEELRARGFAFENDVEQFKNLNESGLKALACDPLPWKRTVGIKLMALKKRAADIPWFIAILKNEKKLYTKIAISDVLAEWGETAAEQLIPELGSIGNNQHKVPALVDLNKKSFPLPRDIVARILIRMGPSILPGIIIIIKTGTPLQKSEAIDVFGHITFYHGRAEDESVLFELWEQCDGDELIKWKIIRALQAFPTQKACLFLKDLKSYGKNEIAVLEAQRSLARIEEKLNSRM